MTIPKITHQHYWSAVVQLTGNVKPHDICNKAIEIALAEQQESEYITAEQARELGAGNAEWRSGGYSDWQICGEDFQYFSLGVKYRAIKQAQSKPIDPHAAIRAEYAKQVAEGTTGFYLWELKNSTDKWVAIGYPSWSSDCIYHCTDISCYVSKDGEPAIRMLRTEAQELQRKLGDTVAWLWGSGGPFGGVVQAVDGFDFIGGTYTYTHSAPFTPITADMVTDEMIEECYPEYFSKKDKAFKEMARLAIVPAYNAVGKYMGAKK